ncbi:hypothetical protein ACVMH6_006426 [Rhizobium leguminosarum]
MKTDNQQKLRADRVWLSEEACDLDDFRSLCGKGDCACRLPLGVCGRKKRADL